jgi:sugar lactone lactonase YvrE
MTQHKFEGRRGSNEPGIIARIGGKLKGVAMREIRHGHEDGCKSGTAKLLVVLLFILTLGLSANAAGSSSKPGMVITQFAWINSLAYGGFSGGSNIAVNSNGDVIAGNEWGFNSSGANGQGIVLVNGQTGAVTTLVSDLSYVGGSWNEFEGAVAVDSANNVYVAPMNHPDIVKIPYVNGGYTPLNVPAGGVSGMGMGYCTGHDTVACLFAANTTGSVTAWWFGTQSIAFDAAGDFFLATVSGTTQKNTIVECNLACLWSGGSAVEIYQNSNPIGSIAIDSLNNIYFSDNTTSSVYEIPYTSGAYATTPTKITPNIPPFTWGDPIGGLAVDAKGNVYIGENWGGYGVSVIPNEGGTLNGNDAYPISPNSARVMTIAGNGDIYLGGYSGAGGGFSVGRLSMNHIGFAASPVGTATAATADVMINDGNNCPTLSFSASKNGVASTEVTATLGWLWNGTASVQCLSFNNYYYQQLSLNMTPTAVGERSVVFTATDPTANTGSTVSAMAYGIGQGSLLTLDPGVSSAYATGVTTPAAVAVDAKGDIFIADSNADTVSEYPVGSAITTTPTTILSKLNAPAGLAFDASGNLYIADTGNKQILEIPAVGGVLNVSGKTTLVASTVAFAGVTLSGPTGLAVGPDGTLYISDTGNNRVVVYDNGSTGVRATGLNSPMGIAVDGSNALYVANTGANEVLVYNGDVLTALTTGISAPQGVAFDNSGSVLIANTGDGQILRVPNEGGALNPIDQKAVETGFASPGALTTDAAGNLYVLDATVPAVYAISRAGASVNFGKVNLGASSSAQTIYVESAGNQPITLASPVFTALAANSPFALAAASSNGCTKSAVVAAGYVCNLSATLAPTTSTSQGTLTQGQTATVATSSTLTAVTPSLTANLALNGTVTDEVPVTITMTVTSPTGGNPIYGENVVVQAVITPTKASSFTPTGTYTLSVDGSNQKAVSIGSGTVTWTLSSLNAGIHIVQASYGGDNNFASGVSNVLDVTVNQAATSTVLTFSADQASPLSSTTLDGATATATVTPAFAGLLSGNVVFYNGTTVLGTSALAANTVTTNGVSVTTYTASYFTPTQGTYQISAVYQGNTNYSSSSTAAQTLTIYSGPTFTATVSGTAITASAGSSTSVTFTTTPLAGFQGSVNYTCTGLPANATCNFNPYLTVLVATTTATATSPIHIPAVTTTLTVLVNQAPVVTPTAIPWAVALLFGLALFTIPSLRRARKSLLGALMLLFLSLVALTAVNGCGGGSIANKTPAGSYAVTVTATGSDCSAVSSSGATCAVMKYSPSPVTINLTVQ